MKNYLLLTAMLVVSLFAKAQTTDLVFEDVTVPSGSSTAVATVSVSTLKTSASSFQCDIIPAPGMTIAKATRASVLKTIDEDSEDYVYVFQSAATQDNGRRYLSYSGYSYESKCLGCTPELFNVTFNTAGLADGVYVVNVKNIEFGNGNGEKLQSMRENSFKITIGNPGTGTGTGTGTGGDNPDSTDVKQPQPADLVCANVSVPSGSATAVASFKVSTLNTTASSFQCDVRPANGMTIAKSSRGSILKLMDEEESYIYTFQSSQRTDGSRRYLSYSAKSYKDACQGTDGELFNVTFNTEGMPDGVYTIDVYNVEFGNPMGEKVNTYKSFTFDITIGTPHDHHYLYSCNDDGTHTGHCQYCNYTFTEPHNFVNNYCTVCGAPDPSAVDTNIDAYKNIVFVKGMEAKAGKQVVLSLQMNNAVAATGFQCDLVLPKGVTVAKDEDGFDLIELSTARTSSKKTDFFNSASQPDGSIRIMCSSTQSYTFTGNTGEVATIVVNIDKNIAKGKYPMLLKNVVISDVNAQTVKVPYVKTTLEISTYTLGDANDDGDINVGDFTAIANYILGNPPASFVEPAADVNEDGDINVGDLTGEANLILYGKVRPNGAKPRAARFSDVAVADQAIEAGKELTVDVAINGSYAFSGYQFDMVLPVGVTVKNAYLSTDRTNAKATDLFTSSMIDSNTLRVVCASTTGAEFEGAEGSVARIVLVADNSYINDNIVNVENIILSSNADVVMPQATSFVLRAAGTTGINNINAGADATIYDLTGKKMNSSRLQKGVYVVNGKKMVK